MGCLVSLAGAAVGALVGALVGWQMSDPDALFRDLDITAAAVMGALAGGVVCAAGWQLARRFRRRA